MSNTQPVFYRVADTAIDQMSEEEIRTESDDLKREIITIEMRMGEKKAWAKAEGATDEYLKWVAKSKNFYARLMTRYTVVRAALRNLNRRSNRAK